MGLTLIWRETLALVYDEEGGRGGMGEGKLDAGEASGKGMSAGRRRGKSTYLSSSASLRMGVPVCMVCMRST